MSAYRYNSAYVYHEFPKWVRTYDGRDIIVQDADEEREVTTPPDEPKRRGRPPGSKNKQVSDDHGVGPNNSGS